MKNKKFFSIIFFIFYLISANNLLGEEFYFETPEIEILNDGNLIKATYKHVQAPLSLQPWAKIYF